MGLGNYQVVGDGVHRDDRRVVWIRVAVHRERRARYKLLGDASGERQYPDVDVRMLVAESGEVVQLVTYDLEARGEAANGQFVDDHLVARGGVAVQDCL